MKNLIKILSLLLIMSAVTFIACNKKELLDIEKGKSGKVEIEETKNLRIGDFSDLIQIEELENYFNENYLKLNKAVNWRELKNAEIIHSIAMYSDSTFILGFNIDNIELNNTNIGEIDFNSGSWKDKAMEIVEIIKDGDENAEIFTDIDNIKLPHLFFKSANVESIAKLLDIDEVIYIEPSFEYFIFIMSQTKENLSGEWGFIDYKLNNIGCGCVESTFSDPSSNNYINPLDYETLDETSGLALNIVPWNYELARISDTGAWSKSTGSGVGVAIIDTGVSFDQENLLETGTLNDGQSSGRTAHIQNFLPVYWDQIYLNIPGPGGLLMEVGTYGEVKFPTKDISNAQDLCGHGTSMAGIIGAPRGNDGNVVGIAYNSNLFHFRAVHNPIILTNHEKNAVANALTEVAGNPNIQIASMSLGQLPWNQPAPIIENAIDLADNAGKLLVAAAGTGAYGFAGIPGFNFSSILGFDDVLFPAESPLTVAMTGIKEPFFDPIYGFAIQENCDNCFHDVEVDYTVIMQRDDNLNYRFALTTGCDGDIPNYVSGSSASTASFSAMAALVWSYYGTATPKSDILQKFTNNSYVIASGTSVSNDYGYGFINVNDAMY